MERIALLALVAGLVMGVSALVVPSVFRPSVVSPALVPETGPRLPLRERIGINVVYANVPSDVAQVAGWARDYHRWYWYEPERGRLEWATTKQQVDRFYGALSGLGVRLLVNVGMVPSWASSNGTTGGLPYPRGASGSMPADYRAHAEYLAQLAARYGATRRDSWLKSPDGLSGQGWVQAIEGWNEPNQSWAEPRFPPASFARMLEADYDGASVGGMPDSSLLVGVKQGDPKMLAVMPGLAGPDTRYLDEAMRSRSLDRRLPFDALNFHWFAKGDPDQGGKAPEAAGLRDALTAMRSWRDAYAATAPIWLTEIGWDTNSRVRDGRSVLYAPEATAAAYLVRAALIALASGADKLFVFTYRDHDSASRQQYSTSGLVENTSVSEGADGRKKAGWYYMATMTTVLGGMVMQSADRQGDGNPAIYLYRLAEPGGTRRAAVAWARNPRVERDDGTTIPRYQLPLPGATRAELVSLQTGSSAGLRSTLELRNAASPSAQALVALEETPIIVEYWSR